MMASLSSSSPGKPLRLKDFLRDDPNSDSCGGAGCGFRITTTPGRLPEKTVRYLLAMELGDASAGDRTLTKCRSNKGPLTKLTAVINTVKMLPFSASPSAAGCGHSCATPFPKQGGGGGGGFLSRSFSRKLRRSFWRKRDKVEHRVESSAAVRTIVRVKDIVRLRSFGDERRGLEPPTEKAVPRSPPSPVRSAHSRTTSSSSSGGGGGAVGGPWSDSDSAGSDSFSCGTSVCGGELKENSPDADANHCASPRSPYMARVVGGDSISKSTSHREPKTKEEEKGEGAKGMVGGCPRHFEEEKDQLSPVSVMDFPFEEDDDDDAVGGDVDAARVAASPTAFRRSLADIERTKHQLLQKIREFESLAALVDPVDLESRFESSEEENEAVAAADGQLLQFQLEVEERAVALLRDVKLHGGPPVKMAAADELLVDFFIERLSYPPHDNGGVRSRMKRQPDRAAEAAAEEEEALLRAAEDWIAGRRRGEAAKGWEGEVREMETDGRWRRCHVDEEEEEEIAGDLGDRVLDALVDELLADLF